MVETTLQSTAPPPLLAGVTLIDLSRMLAGPFATMTLASLGARVVKVAGNPVKVVGLAEPKTFAPPPQSDEHRTRILAEFAPSKGEEQA